jgi:glycosyltransferase involved in cell wall biosynthesis
MIDLDMKVAAIIPVYNEEKTIGSIINTLKESPLVDEIIVVDDGSNDKSSQIAKAKEAKVIKLDRNYGKGTALTIGAKNTDAPFLLFLDGDLVGLTCEHIKEIAEPVLKGEYDMCIGTIDRSHLGKIFSYLIEKTESPFSGTRVLKKEFFEKIPEDYKREYYIESVITYFAKKQNLKIKPIVLKGVGHVIKEKKLGFWEGFKARVKMFVQIGIINIILRIH